MVEHAIRLTSQAGDEFGTVSYERNDLERKRRLVLKYRGRAIEESASDYFKAFCDMRERLEKEGLRPVCYGASLNVYPSGMGRDMGAGLKAYRMVVGKHATDLVHIFESGPDVIPSTVAEQRKFVESWLKSPRS